MSRILFVGDISIQGSHQDFHIDKTVKKVFSDYDYRICNVEGPICSENLKKSPKAGPSLCQSSFFEEIIDKFGFNFFALANNHIGDYGVDGISKTIDFLESKYSNNYVGVRTDGKPSFFKIIKTNDCSIAIVNAAEKNFGSVRYLSDSYGAEWLFDDLLIREIVKLKKENDYVILLPHAGAEDINYPLPEWRRAYKYFIDAGVDIVIGNHPHVMQGIEEYKGKKIIYSLGNFLWQKKGGEIAAGDTFAVGLDISKTKMSVNIIPLKVENTSISLDQTCSIIQRIDEYSKFLHDDNSEKYQNYIDNHCVKKYKNEYTDYIHVSAGGYRLDSIGNFIKAIIKTILLKAKINDVFVYHNIAVETNNWIYQRALETIKVKGNKKDE